MPIQSGRSARSARGHRGGRAASAESGAAGEGSEVCKQYGGASAALRANFGLFFRARAIAGRGGAARAHRGPGPRSSSLPAPAAVSSSVSWDEKTCKEAMGRKEGREKKKPIGDRPRLRPPPRPAAALHQKALRPGQPPPSAPTWGWTPASSLTSCRPLCLPSPPQVGVGGACDCPRYPKDAEVTGSLGTRVRVVLTRGWGLGTHLLLLRRGPGGGLFQRDTGFAFYDRAHKVAPRLVKLPASSRSRSRGFAARGAGLGLRGGAAFEISKGPSAGKGEGEGTWEAGV